MGTAPGLPNPIVPDGRRSTCASQRPSGRRAPTGSCAPDGEPPLVGEFCVGTGVVSGVMPAIGAGDALSRPESLAVAAAGSRGDVTGCGFGADGSVLTTSAIPAS